MLLLKTDIKSDIWIQKSSFPNTDTALVAILEWLLTILG